ncbi:MAG: hypothetical protein KIS92_21180 [Planctomycetota bacterium]|nr:hypothetical protein [Planctomycetota bacterium]
MNTNQVHLPGRRSSYVTVNADRSIALILLKNGKIEVEEKDRDAKITIQITNRKARTNAKKPFKPFLKYYIDPSRPFSGFDEDFEHLHEMYAVDTSNRQLTNGDDLKVCVAILGKATPRNPSKYGEECKFDLLPSYVFITRHNNPELIGLHWLVYGIQNSAGYDPNRKIGLVLDTEFSLQDEFNLRKRPYLADYYLPDNFTIIYASSDTGQHLPNKMIRICDVEGKRGLKLQEVSANAAAQDLGDKPFHILARIEWKNRK